VGLVGRERSNASSLPVSGVCLSMRGCFLSGKATGPGVRLAPRVHLSGDVAHVSPFISERQQVKLSGYPRGSSGARELLEKSENPPRVFTFSRLCCRIACRFRGMRSNGTESDGLRVAPRLVFSDCGDV
jgi:hypothetical protein